MIDRILHILYRKNRMNSTRKATGGNSNF